MSESQAPPTSSQSESSPAAYTPGGAAELLAAKLDAKLNAIQGYAANSLQGWLSTLLTRGWVEVGCRESCSSTHITMKIWREWVRVVARLKRDGWAVSEEAVKHGNAYAGNNGGFWNSTIFSVSGGAA